MSKSKATIVAVWMAGLLALTALAGENGGSAAATERKSPEDFQLKELDLKMSILDKQYELLAMQSFDLQLKRDFMDLESPAAPMGSEKAAAAKLSRDRTVLNEKLDILAKRMTENRAQAQRCAAETDARLRTLAAAKLPVAVPATSTN